MQWIAQNWIWVVLAVGAFYFFSRHWHGAAGHGAHEHSGHTGSTEVDREGPTVDPVSGKEVGTAQALTAYYHGRPYYFENAHNRELFEAAPERYVGDAPAASSTEPSRHRRHGCC